MLYRTKQIQKHTHQTIRHTQILCVQSSTGSATIKDRTPPTYPRCLIKVYAIHIRHQEMLCIWLPMERQAQTDQPRLICWLIWVFTGCTCCFVCFVAPRFSNKRKISLPCLYLWVSTLQSLDLKWTTPSARSLLMRKNWDLNETNISRVNKQCYYPTCYIQSNEIVLTIWINWRLIGTRRSHVHITSLIWRHQPVHRIDYTTFVTSPI